jgi:hypothetical protein
MKPSIQNVITIGTCLLLDRVGGFGMLLSTLTKTMTSKKDEVTLSMLSKRPWCSSATPFRKVKSCDAENSLRKLNRSSTTKKPTKKRASSIQASPWLFSLAKIFSDLPNPLVAGIAVTLSLPWTPTSSMPSKVATKIQTSNYCDSESSPIPNSRTAATLFRPGLWQNLAMPSGDINQMSYSANIEAKEKVSAFKFFAQSRRWGDRR